MSTHLFALLEDESGATALEYGLIVALIVIAMIAGMNNFSTALDNLWNGVQNSSTGAMG